MGSESDILGRMRRLVTMLPANNEDDMSYEECTDSLNRACPGLQRFKRTAGPVHAQCFSQSENPMSGRDGA